MSTRSKQNHSRQGSNPSSASLWYRLADFCKRLFGRRKKTGNPNVYPLY